MMQKAMRSINEEWLDVIIAVATVIGFLSTIGIVVAVGSVYFKVYDAVIKVINKRG